MKSFLLLLLISCSLVASAQVRLRVAGEQGQSLSGASVTWTKGSGRTDTAGFVYVPAGIRQVHIAHVGFRDSLVVLPLSGNLTVFLVSGTLSEVIVSTGYQDLPKERATGSFVPVGRDLIERSVTTNITDRLRDNVPGLQFLPGSESFRVHGQSTLFSNADPLIVVDGFPFNEPIQDINPNDVETITVLKDAAAASIWGTRAGNGVVVITTKKGRYNQAARVNFSVTVNVAEKPNLFYIPSMSSADYISIEKNLFNQGYYNATIASPYHLPLSPTVELLLAQQNGTMSAADVNAALSAEAGQNVKNDISKYYYRPSVDQQYAASLSGGSAVSRYFLSAGFDKNLDNLVGNGLDRVTIKGTNTWSFLDKKLEVTAGINVTQTNTQLNNPGAPTWNQGFPIYPYAKLADAPGNPLATTRDYRLSYVQAAPGLGLQDWSYRPLQELALGNNHTQVNDYRLNTGLKYHLPLGFALEVLYQYDNTTNSGRNLMDANSYYTRNLINRFTQDDGFGDLSFPVPLGGILDLANSTSENHDGRAQLDFNRTFGSKHELTAIAGYEIQSLRVRATGSRQYGYDAAHATSLPVDGATYFSYYDNPNSGNIIPGNQSETDQTDHSISYYANAAYTYDGRLTVSGSARLDQDNLFGVNANQKGVPLYSLGGSWALSKESFYKLSWLPDMKLRATFGYNGNINKSLSAYTTAQYQDGNNQLTLLPFATIINPPNPNLRWEKNQNINLGADFGLKGGWLTGSLDVFWKKGMDLIGQTAYPPSTGITVFTGNDASTSGHGFDLALQSRNLSGKLGWTTNFFVSYVTDVVTHYQQASLASSYLQFGNNGQYALQGKPLYAIYSYQWAGLDPATGDPQGYLNGAVSKNYTAMAAAATPNNLVYNGPSRPPVFGSLRNSFSYGNFNFSFTLGYELAFYFRKTSVIYGTNEGLNQQSGDWALRWQKPGDEAHTNVPSLPAVSNAPRDDFYTYSSALVAKGDNIRLRDLRLGYRIRYGELYCYASNVALLWRANKFGLDPDYPKTFPAPLTIAGGLRINL